ncbi:hypothetical protein A4G20_02100 [Pasteurellaceae bacterium RH1A]|nr:hypothetical protein A4G20_02100 [Pasteurellaceae bacterium RH1A]
MKKFKKLIKDPIKFLQDSWMFKCNYLEYVKKTKNLFVISHLGQLAQVEGLIKKEKFLNCVLVIIYTKKNLEMPKLVQKNANKALFNTILLLKIPSFPNVINIKALTIINNSYRVMIDKIKPHRLFILSFEKHYNLLCALAKEKKIELNLIEEGTATYKYKDYNEAINTLKSSFTAKEKKSIFLIKNFFLLRQLRPAIGLCSEFNKVYAVFPELLDPVFKIKEKKEFFLYEDIKPDHKIFHIINQYNITDNDILFLNQRYPFPHDIYAEGLLNILSQYSQKYNSKVFIKLHPKDPIELKNMLFNKIQEKGLLNKILLLDEYGFLIEGLISQAKPKVIIALTSTGLIYGKKISENSLSASIYPLLKDNMLEKLEYSDKTFKESDEHFHILKRFKNIDFIEKSDQI